MDELAEIRERIARIEALLSQHGALCPNREIIAKAANNIEKLEELERTFQAFRLEITRGGMMGGFAGSGLIALLSGVIMALGKALGWW